MGLLCFEEAVELVFPFCFVGAARLARLLAFYTGKRLMLVLAVHVCQYCLIVVLNALPLKYILVMFIIHRLDMFIIHREATGLGAYTLFPTWLYV